MIRKLLFLFALLTFGVTVAQDGFESKIFYSENDSLQYRIQYPLDYDEGKKYPLVLFLHGAGERGDNNQSQLVHGAKVFANPANRTAFPAIVIFPQCPKNSYWSNATVDRTGPGVKLTFHPEKPPTPHLQMASSLVKNFIDAGKVDTSRVYVAGLSMGGMGTFEIVQRNPNLFAAAIAICGGGSPETVKNYADKTPFWIIHGSRDDVVDPVLSLKMAQAMFEAGANPRITFYENANHNSWDPAFAEPDFLLWLFGHAKND